MKILLDECMPELLRKDITGHFVTTVGEMGWAGTKNSKLLNVAGAAHFDILLMVDRNIEYQQNLHGRQIAVIVLDAPSKLPRLRPLIPSLLDALETIQPGDLVHVRA